MKPQTYIFLLLIALTFGCEADDDGNSGTKNYEFYDDAFMSIAISQEGDYLNIEPGENIVFKYHFVADDNPRISDDEYAESIYFEVDGNLDSFSYIDAELQDHKLLIRRSCFCTYRGLIFTDIGSINGTKLSNSNWDVDITMTFELGDSGQTETRTISGIFRRAPIPD